MEATYNTMTGAYETIAKAQAMSEASLLKNEEIAKQNDKLVFRRGQLQQMWLRTKWLWLGFELPNNFPSMKINCNVML